MKSKDIINRVANSNLTVIDLIDYSPKKEIVILDLSTFLFNGSLLKEKVFRKTLTEFDFSVYKNKLVAIYSNPNTILPMWAFMLLCSCLNNIASEIHFGSKEEVFEKVCLINISSINPNNFENKKVIVKGCSNIHFSESLYIAISKKLIPVVNSLMFGEACSAVPIYKKKK